MGVSFFVRKLPRSDRCLVYLVGVTQLLRLTSDEISDGGLTTFHGPTHNNLDSLDGTATHSPAFLPAEADNVYECSAYSE